MTFSGQSAQSKSSAGIGEQEERHHRQGHGVRGDHDAPLGAGLQAARRRRQEHVDRGGEVERSEGLAEGEQHGDVRAAEHADEPGEAGRGHEHADAVVGPARPGKQPDPHEAPAHREREGGPEAARGHEVAGENEREVDEAEDQAGRGQAPERSPQRGQSSASRAAPESSDLGMKPRTPVRTPMSSRSRLEVRTIAGAEPFALEPDGDLAPVDVGELDVEQDHVRPQLLAPPSAPRGRRLPRRPRRTPRPRAACARWPGSSGDRRR